MLIEVLDRWVDFDLKGFEKGVNGSYTFHEYFKASEESEV